MADTWLLPQLLRHGVVLLGTALVLNTLVTFAGALALALLAAKAAGSARLAKLILITPWLRVLWDMLRGAAPGAFVLSPYAGTQAGPGSFQLGVGTGAPLIPFVHAELSMQGGDRQRYAYSAGDMLGHWLFRHVGATPMLVVLALLLAVSLVLLAARARQWLSWRARLARAEAAASAVESVRLGARQVTVITGAGGLGPFTTGVFRSRIWLPAELEGGQRAAVLEHELAHVRDLDVLWFGCVGTLTDLFWFVPGARYLERCLHERAEEAADARAMACGVAPRVLAQSILAHAAAAPHGTPPARMSGGASRLQRRLLALAPRPRPSKRRHLLQLVLAAMLTASLFRSVFLGYA
jgi:hypothetical protein